MYAIFNNQFYLTTLVTFNLHKCTQRVQHELEGIVEEHLYYGNDN